MDSLKHYLCLGGLAVALTIPACSRGVGDNESVTLDEVERLSYVPSETSHHSSVGRVKVELSSAWRSDGLLIVRCAFTPDDPGFHLYSSGLPRDGIDGIGRPTRVEAAEPGRFTEIHELLADKAPKLESSPALDATFPIYPDGPVNLYLPLRFASDSDTEKPVSLKLTYMSCSDTTCNMPVEDALVTLDVPKK